MADPASGMIMAIRRQIVLVPDDRTSLLQLARLHEHGDRLHAAACYGRVIALATDGQYFYELANTFLGADEPVRALTAYRRSIALLPAVAPILSNAAEAMARLAQVFDTIRWQRRVLGVNRGAAPTLANLAQALTRVDRPDAGMRMARGALCLEPALAAAHVNAGLAINGLGERTQAERLFRRALSIDPGGAEGAFALSTCLLAAGDLRRGFRLYRRRFDLVEMRRAQDYWSVPPWDGRFRAGLRVLLWCEQGFGDAIHFIRYAPIIASRGVEVTIVAPDPLLRLFSRLGPEIRVCGLGDALPPVDAHAALMSLPHLLETDLDTIPVGAPYLTADPADARPDLSGHASPRIGFAWSGRPEYKTDRMRSLSAEILPMLVAALARSGGTLYSLQVGPRRGDLSQLTTPVIDLAGGFRDFADTAAAMSRLDLVVTIDSAVAHLAGALGRPTWVMLGYVPEWRWLEKRDDSPWYPTMRLWRQPRRGDWPGVIAAIADAFSTGRGRA